MKSKKLTHRQASRIKEDGSKTANRNLPKYREGICWHCGKPLTKADEEAGRRRICVECY